MLPRNSAGQDRTSLRRNRNLQESPSGPRLGRSLRLTCDANGADHDPALLGSSDVPQRGNVIQPSGCEERATLGAWTKNTTNPNGVEADNWPTGDATPLG